MMGGLIVNTRMKSDRMSQRSILARARMHSASSAKVQIRIGIGKRLEMNWSDGGERSETHFNISDGGFLGGFSAAR